MNAAPSLRTRLLLLLLVTVVAGWGATALSSFFDTRHEIDEIFDAQLAQSAKLLLAQASHDMDELNHKGDGIAMEVRSDEHKYERRLTFQLWNDKGRLLVRSEGAPEQPFSAAYLKAGPFPRDNAEPRHGPNGTRRGRFDDVDIGGTRWRVFSHWDGDGEILVQVGERYDVRQELAVHVAGRLLLPLAIGLPLLGVLAWLAVGRGFAPLRRFGSEVAARDPRNLAPLDTHGAPEEIQPLADAINTLMERLGAALENERRFTADAAHELRTPLAALKTHAQVALRAEDAAPRRAALESLLLGTDRATHLVEQLLTLARLDPEADALANAPEIDLAALTRQTVATIAPAAVAKDIEIELLSPATDIRLRGKADWLGVLLRNLLDNAVRYTPAGGRVKVMLHASGQEARLDITDSGPGIPPQDRARVFDRFHRLPGNEAPGSGLGLSIAQRIADLHGARIELGDGEGGEGLRVSVCFPQNQNSKKHPS